MNPETFVSNLVGIKNKSPKIRALPLLGFDGISKLDSFLHKTVVKGFLPAEGPALVVSNHMSMWDIAKGYDMSVHTAGRIMFGVARETLINPDLKESKEVLKRAGKTSDPLNKAPRFVRRIISFILTDVSIAVPRGAQTLGALRPTIRACNQAFADQHMVGVFVQETRVKEGDLRNVMDGPAFLAGLNPDIPIYPVAIYEENGHHVASIGDHFTANQAKLDPSIRTDLDQITAMTVYIVDHIADMLPDAQRNDWYERRKQEYLQSKK